MDYFCCCPIDIRRFFRNRFKSLKTPNKISENQTSNGLLMTKPPRNKKRVRIVQGYITHDSEESLGNSGSSEQGEEGIEKSQNFHLGKSQLELIETQSVDATNPSQFTQAETAINSQTNSAAHSTNSQLRLVEDMDVHDTNCQNCPTKQFICRFITKDEEHNLPNCDSSLINGEEPKMDTRDDYTQPPSNIDAENNNYNFTQLILFLSVCSIVDICIAYAILCCYFQIFNEH